MNKNLMRLLTIGAFGTLACVQHASAQNSSPYWSAAGNNNATASSKLGTTSSVPLRLFTNNAERLRITEAGRIGIGISTPINILTVKTGGGTPASSWTNVSTQLFYGFSEDANGEFNIGTAADDATHRSLIQLKRARGTLTSPKIVQNNDYLASVLASGYDGSAFQNPASLDFYVDGTPTAGHVPGRLSFVTGTNGSDRTERLKVGSSGDFTFNNGQLFLKQSTGAFGIGTITPGASALVDISSTSRGFLMPRMTQAQRNAIASPATGLQVYQTDNTPGFYYYSGSAWKAVTPASSTSSGWSLTGNSGTSPGTNFVGTTDAKSLLFKVNNLQAGLIDYSTYNTGTRSTAFGQIALNSNTSGTDNTALGYGSLYTNTTGNFNVASGKYSLYNNNADNNTALGFNTMFFNTTGTSNTATGSVSLQNNTSGQQNTANGYAALYSNNSGSYNSATGAASLNSNTNGVWNTANGAYAMYKNTTGYYNTAIGGNALYSNTDGTNNTANGYNTLYSNISGYYNTAIGVSSLYANTTGNSNTATGLEALHFNTTGSYNTAYGVDALLSNTTADGNTGIGNGALQSNTSGNGNTATGDGSMFSNTTGNYNTASGVNALAYNYTGIDNTANGFYALYLSNGSNNTATGFAALSSNGSGSDNTAVGHQALASTTVSYNTAVGYRALYANTTGYNNTSLGIEADVSAGDLVNSTAIGANAVVNASNKIRLGDGGITVVESNAGSWTTSDGRFKNNIKDSVKGLEFIKMLKPVTYNFDTKKFQEFLIQKYPDSIKTKRIAAMNKDAMAKATSVIQSGFIAQEVADAVKKSGYNFNGVHAPDNATDNWSLSYEKMVVPLVKAVQELSKINDDNNAKIDDLQKQINDLKAMISSGQATTNRQSVVISSASLKQNVPNPFTNTTSIGYTLPTQFTGAKIVITDKSGKALKAIDISGSGEGTVKIDAATMASGAYQYSLLINGKLISTRQMVSIK